MGIFARERPVLLLFQFFFLYFSEEVPDLGRMVEICILVPDFKIAPCSEFCMLSSG